MRKTVFLKLKRIFIAAAVFLSLSFSLSVTADAAMSVSEIEKRLSAYSDYIVNDEDGVLYMEHSKYDISEDGFKKCVKGIASALMGEAVEDYCKVQIKFFFTHKPYGSDFKTFGENIFRLKKELGNFWTEWSRYNKMTVTATSYSGGEKFSANVILYLNGSEPDKWGAAYDAKLLEIVGRAKEVCTTDMEKVQYYLGWLDENARYDIFTGWTNDPYYALIKGRTVCGGYANAFKDLCNASGIPATVPVNQSINHAWSQVYVDGIWYTADLCDVIKSRSGSYNGYLFTDPDTDYDCREFVEDNRGEYIDSFEKGANGSISGCKFTYDSSHNYKGSAIKPSVKVTDGKKTLKAGTHYTVTYSSNILPGTATITLEGIEKNGYAGKKVLYFKINVPRPELSAETSVDSALIRWKKISTATGYIVRLYNSQTGGYDDMAKVSGDSCRIKNLVAGKKYIFAVKTYIIIGTKEYQSQQSEIIVSVKVPKVQNLKASAVTKNSVKLSWSKVTGADRYEVYMSTNGKSWSRRATVTTASYTVKSLKSNKKYYFKVRAVDGTAKGSFSSGKSATTLLSTPKATLSAGKKNLTVKWNKVSGASGYVIYYSTNKNMSSVKKINVKGGSKVKTTLKKLKSKKRYYVKVKAYKTVNGKRIYGDFSSAVSKKTK